MPGKRKYYITGTLAVRDNHKIATFSIRKNTPQKPPIENKSPAVRKSSSHPVKKKRHRNESSDLRPIQDNHSMTIEKETNRTGNESGDAAPRIHWNWPVANGQLLAAC